MKKRFYISLIYIFPFFCFAETVEVPFTLDDRDRLIRLEGDLKSLHNEMNIKFESIIESMNVRFDAQQQQINDLKYAIADNRTLFFWGFGIIIVFMLFIFGYIIWDRRTALFPVREKTFSLDEKMKAIEKVLKEFGKEQPKFAEILRTHGL